MVRRRSSRDIDTLAALAGTATFAVSTAVFSSHQGTRETRVFTTINEWPDSRLLRVPQQFGTPWTLPLAGAVLWASGRPREAAAAAFSLPVSKGIEVAVKKVLQRPRPLYETPTALRDDAPLEGPSFPSGHAALAAATAYLLARAAPSWALPLAALTVASSLVRVHQGAHWPSDACAGGALGVTVAAALRRITVPPR
ncbi:phosphatase PAP2 family protein [Aeromicrobium sp. Marseille-Q0843]|uniref:Phosphatase PAP2 family protein n=1 Tax=Aeromicrobium phoceense TaxID=2754045 RepID=A0A838XLB0_9ACTN|nr:phosphatase PAP2 family protein [Aeromicrobium phoceense]MBA4609568.1 phosphatase PAP2 family protein [Aeromicrobium phoceense]